MDNVIELKRVNKIYKGPLPTQVLFDINLSFPRSSFNAIIGSSGSGKSTILNILGTLDRPTDGDVLINGDSTVNLSKDALAELRNETIGFVFQSHFLLPEFTALENVLLPYQIRHLKAPKEVLSRAHDLMEKMGLEKVKNNLSTRMSGGQQQRTAIARALINQPDILLADEPTGNLDSQSTETIYALLRDIHEELKMTYVIITHDQRVAERADRIIEISDGRIAMDIMR